MADTTQPVQPVQLESGTYEILRSRLKGHGTELRARLQRLNEDRKQVFGSVDFRLLATDRVTTAHNCVPRDMVAVGSRFLFGYNVHFGLKSERHIADVFACYAFHPDSHTFQEVGLESLQDPRFLKDFQDVYRYYKDATFARFHAAGPHLYMVFQVGRNAQDIKSFKWLIDGDELRYLDNRSDHEVRFPPQHEFEWKRTTRDHHRQGSHPHVSIEDRLFYVLQPPLETWLRGQELIMPFEPFPYQYEGIAWLFAHDSALLADEMGLGKTMQTITAIRLAGSAALRPRFPLFRRRRSGRVHLRAQGHYNTLMARPRNDLVDYMTYLLVRVVAMLFAVFPIDLNLRTARWMGWVWYRIMPRHRERAREHLRLAFGNGLSDQEADDLALKSMQQMTMMAVEELFVPRLITKWT